MIEVEIDDPAWTRAVPDAAALAEAAARAALDRDGAITVTLTDDATVADLNHRFRHRPGPTNVLSFPSAESARPFLGDVILAFGVCAREAEVQAKPLADHLRHLVVHGALHLLGHDHGEPAQAEIMEARERTLLARMGVPDPYAVPE